MADDTMDEGELKNLVRAEGSNLAEGLRPLLEKEVDDVVRLVRGKFELFRRMDPETTPQKAVEATLNDWKAEKLAIFTYGRYKKYMEEHGHGLDEIYSFSRFKTHQNLGWPMKFWRVIEEEGIRDGSKIRRIENGVVSPEVRIVKEIAIDCCLILEGGVKGRIKPVNCIAVDESEG